MEDTHELILEDGTGEAPLAKLYFKEGVLGFYAKGSRGGGWIIYFFLLLLASFAAIVFWVTILLYADEIIEKSDSTWCYVFFPLILVGSVIIPFVTQGGLFGCRYEISREKYKFRYGLFRFKFVVRPSFRILIDVVSGQDRDWHCSAKIYTNALSIFGKEISLPFTLIFRKKFRYLAIRRANEMKDWIINNSWIPAENIIIEIEQTEKKRRSSQDYVRHLDKRK